MIHSYQKEDNRESLTRCRVQKKILEDYFNAYCEQS